MGLFSKKDKKDKKEAHEHGHEKMPSASDLHDPILKAVHEQQPWQDMTNDHLQEAITPSGALRDVFGNPISNPDISNPARSRDERPLDTIRSFQYATTGDDSLRGAMETQQLGFTPRQDFDSMPKFETNPYSNNVISFGDPNAPEGSTDHVQDSQYFLEQKDQGKKKKRGLFGRKKKD